jgi:hypothetical protein
MNEIIENIKNLFYPSDRNLLGNAELRRIVEKLIQYTGRITCELIDLEKFKECCKSLKRTKS